MSDIHDQAMNYVYQQVLHRLLGFYSRAERTALQLFIQRLIVAAGGIERINQFRVLVVHPGTRDSSYTLGFVRAAQLSIAGRAPATFNLRVATLRHAGMSQTAMANVHRSYSSLFVYDDPRVEVLMLEGENVLPFSHLSPLCDEGRELNRRNMLLSCHLAPGVKRSTFRNDCYLSMGAFYGRMARWGDGVDVLVSSDSPHEQRRYLTGFSSAARTIGLPSEGTPALDFEDLFSVLTSYGQDYFYQLCADQDHDQVQDQEEVPHNEDFQARRQVAYLGLHDLVRGELEDRWPLLSEFLGFQFDQLTSQVSDTEYVSPLLSAHTHGLRTQFVDGRSYEEGVCQYLQSAALLMRKKNLPEKVIEQMLSAYGNPQRIEERRALASSYAQQTLGLNETQLVCLLFSPFVNAGAGLERFLRCHHPGMLVALPELHKALQTRSAAEQVLQWMVDVSGLSIGLLSKLYRMCPLSAADQVSIDLTDLERYAGPRLTPDSGGLTSEESAGS
ncbi:hypothetical protein [Pseudomonas fluorescens]|uniref:Uncharacterized protein n=1 Tax=Pseudomonas fluorescens TaxID=294 RepID=A0A5E7CKE8_PSEFL|nr:hypothetical protein [Pseudomonas fluorescens]VVO02638.1 hypothetical protein PS691_02753 [Pseudomonas fluorescens]